MSVLIVGRTLRKHILVNAGIVINRVMGFGVGSAVTMLEGGLRFPVGNGIGRANKELIIYRVMKIDDKPVLFINPPPIFIWGYCLPSFEVQT